MRRDIEDRLNEIEYGNGYGKPDNIENQLEAYSTTQLKRELQRRKKRNMKDRI